MEKKEKYNFDDFKEIMEILTGENGCPWDKVQTHDSLRRYLIEECYEAVYAVENKDFKNLCEELGDILLQVVFHSVIGEKNGEFTLDDVIDGVCKKMIFRHPHIFADSSADTPEEVLLNWEELKKKEKGFESKTEALRSVPKNFPALIRAEKVLKKGFDGGLSLGELDESVEKIKELSEFIKNNKELGNEQLMEKNGELLLFVANISRILKLNPEFALTNATEKFINRFEYVENNPCSKNEKVPTDLD